MKKLSASGGFAPRHPDQGLCPVPHWWQSPQTLGIFPNA